MTLHAPDSVASDRPPAPAVALAAVLIMRDEARCIARCLGSVAPFVDAMVVVDTGSTDDSVAIATACGARVHHIDWPDDFAAARNRALDLANADWNLIIDADEWIADGGEALRAFCAGPPRMGSLCVESGFDMDGGDGGAALSRSWITRLLPRGVRYRGRIHEQPISTLPSVRLPVTLGHDGYMDAQKVGKSDRNRPLLLAELARDPANPYILYQLGADAEVGQDYGAACTYYRRALAGAAPDAPWLHMAVVRFLHCLTQSGAHDEALGVVEAQIERWQDSPDFFFVFGNLAMDKAMADPANAFSQWLPLSQSAWERCLEIGERPDLEGAVAGRGSHLARHNLTVIEQQLALFAG